MREIPNKENIWSLNNDKLKQESFSKELSGSITNYNVRAEFYIADRGQVFIVELEEEMLGSDIIEKFKGKIVSINDKLWTVKGVELPAVANRKFLIVGLLVN